MKGKENGAEKEFVRSDDVYFMGISSVGYQNGDIILNIIQHQ